MIGGLSQVSSSYQIDQWNPYCWTGEWASAFTTFLSFPKWLKQNGILWTIKNHKPGGGHSGPRTRRINLPNWMKKQAKRGNGTLNIAFLKTKMLFNSSHNKIEFWLFFCFFLPCQGSLSAIGAKISLLNGQNGHLPENRRYPKFSSGYGGDMIQLSWVHLSPNKLASSKLRFRVRNYDWPIYSLTDGGEV